MNNKTQAQNDIEIVHCSSIHEDSMTIDSLLLEVITEVIDERGFPRHAFKLSRYFLRTTTIALNHCVATSRINAVDFNLRPSVCPTNFLFNEHAVMLEIFKSKSGQWQQIF